MKILIIVLLFLIISWTKGNLSKEFIKSNNLFSAAVYKELSKNNRDNILVSPLSAGIVLTLCHSGAKDETAQEIKSSLKLPNDDRDIKSSLKSLLTSFKNEKGCKVYSANKVYVKKDISLKNEFEQIAKDDFEAELEKIDFSQKLKAANTINQWVEKQTENKIKNLVNSRDFNFYTSLILVNALYFKGNWTHRFTNSSTEKRKFYKNVKESIEVDTMYKYDTLFPYYESAELKAKFLAMPFENGNFSMVICLPNEIEGLAALEKQIEKVFLPHDFTDTFVNLYLPKFKYETEIDFVTILKSLGVVKAFTDKADFSGISGDKGDLYINQVVQKAFIDLNEEGVEATAATKFQMALTSQLVTLMPKPKEFNVNHPFIYYIKFKDIILFTGRVYIPHY